MKYCFVSLFILNLLFPQNTQTVIPAKEYKAGWLHELFFGYNWRDLWASPIEVPVLNTNTFAGGLVAYKKGGGFQTKSLKFKGADGQIYKFRSINKDPKKVLPDELRTTFVADVVQDQISSSHPLAAILAAPLLNAVGILNAQPQLVVLPDSEDLGEFRNEYAGTFGTIELHPNEVDSGETFGNSDKIIGLYKIFEKTDESYKNQVDQHAYLKARLMDMFLGDWDRHVDQWRWARHTKNGTHFYSPIPRDRDQAFVRYKGLFPWLFARSVPQAEGFSESYPLIEDLTWSGRFLDQRFLTKIEKEDWFRITRSVVDSLTDVVIESAVRRMPPSWFAKEGERLISELKQRRDNLFEASVEFYDVIFSYPSIWLSDKGEYVHILQSDTASHLNVFAYKKKKKGKLLFSRTFYRNETSELRIYMQGGKDKFRVEGCSRNAITLRITGDKGKDIFEDKTTDSPHFLSAKTIHFYDSGKKTKASTTANSTLHKEKVAEPKTYNPETDNYNEKYEQLQRDKGYDWKIAPWFGYTSDEGLLLGIGPRLYKFGFRKAPYEYQVTFRGAFAFGPQKSRFDVSYSFPTLQNKLLVTFYHLNTELEFHSFYGLGNTTRYSEQKFKDGFYQIDMETILFQVHFDYKLTPDLTLRVTPFYRYLELKLSEETILSSQALTPFDITKHLGTDFSLFYDSRDNHIQPYYGFTTKFSNKIFYESRKSTTVNLEADFRIYSTLNFFKPTTIAFQTYYAHVFGDESPFYDAVYLGGESNMRTYRYKRFSGDKVISFSGEIRQQLFPLNIVLPSTFGINLLYEVGRVYLKGESSNHWHKGTGVGGFLSFFDRSFVVNFTYTSNKEEQLYLIKTQYSF